MSPESQDSLAVAWGWGNTYLWGGGLGWEAGVVSCLVAALRGLAEPQPLAVTYSPLHETRQN